MTTPTLPVPAPAITELPDGPKSIDPLDVFRAKAYARVDAEQAMVPELNAANEATYKNAVSAGESAVAADLSRSHSANWAVAAADEAVAAMGYRNQAGGHATTATQQAGIAAAKAGESAASAEAARLSDLSAGQHEENAGLQADRSGQEADRAQRAVDSVAEGPIRSLNVYSGSKTGAVTLALSDMGAQATDAQMQAGTATEPMLMSPANVRAAALANSRVQRMARTANTQLITTDSGKWIDITAGTFTQTFLAPAALGAGWWCYLQNSGTGDITIPSSDGRTNWIMYPNEVRLFQCDGSVLRTVVLNTFHKVFASSANFVKPPGYKDICGEMWGGGGSGASSHYDAGFYEADGGCGAACTLFRIAAAALALTTAVVVGSGGPAVVNAHGVAGGSTTFAGFSASGGPGGLMGTGHGSRAALSMNNAPYLNGTHGANAIQGAAGGGSGTSGLSSPSLGFTSIYGGNGGDGGHFTSEGLVTQPKPGVAPGGGGGAVKGSGGTYFASAPGARGEFRAWGVN